jgi:hypothetical protein
LHSTPAVVAAAAAAVAIADAIAAAAYALLHMQQCITSVMLVSGSA